VIERLLRDGTVVARSDGTVHRLFPVAIDAAEGEALREWIVREGATRTIEIGLGYGISALFVCEALPVIRSTRFVRSRPRAGIPYRRLSASLSRTCSMPAREKPAICSDG
jgi:hypothetical protein